MKDGSGYWIFMGTIRGVIITLIGFVTLEKFKTIGIFTITTGIAFIFFSYKFYEKPVKLPSKKDQRKKIGNILQELSEEYGLKYTKGSFFKKEIVEGRYNEKSVIIDYNYTITLTFIR